MGDIIDYLIGFKAGVSVVVDNLIDIASEDDEDSVCSAISLKSEELTDEIAKSIENIKKILKEE